MEETQIVVESMQHKLDTLWGNTNKANNYTIFRTPHNISQRKKNLFKPSVVSIGPFHRGQKHLRAFEEQKWQFLKDFLSHGEGISLDLCISEMKTLEEKTRRCYSETFDDLKSNAFVEMMMLDGCFVLEYFLKLKEENVSYSRVIYRDLLLLENQIPFFIVEKLYKIGIKKDKTNFVNYIAKTFIARGLTEDHLRYHLVPIIPNPPAEIHHLVHLYYHYLVPNPDKPDKKSSKSFDFTSANRIIKGLLDWFCSRPVAFRNSTGNISSMVIPSATELKKKGLKFKPKSNPKHMLDISFEDGVLQIPRLAISAENKLILANLVAFEHSKYANKDSPFTRFVIFLDNLINTVSDVKILQECGIIENWLDSEKEVTQFINQFTEVDIFERDHYLAGLYMKVNGYIESNWNRSWCKRQWAKLISEYFSSPWKAISLFAAFILLVLTCVQTFYAVYAYKFPPSS